MSTATRLTPAPRGRTARTARATASLLAHLAAALMFLVVLEVGFALAAEGRVNLTMEAAYGRGVALAFVLVAAVVLWATPSVLPRRGGR
jgi:hypothetical protein